MQQADGVQIAHASCDVNQTQQDGQLRGSSNDLRRTGTQAQHCCSMLAPGDDDPRHRYANKVHEKEPSRGAISCLDTYSDLGRQTGKGLEL